MCCREGIWIDCGEKFNIILQFSLTVSSINNGAPLSLSNVSPEALVNEPLLKGIHHKNNASTKALND
ncbi:MAG: hypothetical protein ACJAYJ_001302 [Saprospiraceae bacterium]|jgi:hypothetical protein